MATVFTPICPGSGPWYIDREDCIGDSLVYINANTGYLDCKINSLSSSTNTLSTNLITYANGTALLSSTGYQILPGGLIMQWGETGTYTTQANISANFPIPFTTQCLNVQVTWRLNVAGIAGADDTWAQTVRYDRNRVELQIQNSSTNPSLGRVSWFAIGH